jgi:hypothetical protein
MNSNAFHFAANALVAGRGSGRCGGAAGSWLGVSIVALSTGTLMTVIAATVIDLTDAVFKKWRWGMSEGSMPLLGARSVRFRDLSMP